MDSEASVSLNGDPGLRACEDTSQMDWSPSPSGTVWRKRVHLVGPVESGQVTSVVRYEPDSSFAAHDHPDGEEILVLEGTFSDEHGDWPAGSYLLNPEGFRHAPFSRKGCVIFVKLRQYGGRDRRHVAVQEQDLAWEPTERAGIHAKQLYAGPAEDPPFPDEVHLELWAPGANPGTIPRPGGVEILVLKGALQDEDGRYGEGCWLRLPRGSSHTPSSPEGCELYVRSGSRDDPPRTR